ncbi:hypothetical protein MF406_17675 [Georgenia sp. TF02-10]|uniref:hypothetical protein n=1 Tax=Georgenia sp. TF02-10 TaxID=2917725 RepID=UPI001FA72CC6|nr:hypothetical protein [Georgenia sp. TF02-10]UNX54679.1 hypothetical protein MF406_17675 [Georgenia sp. TF02-10]
MMRDDGGRLGDDGTPGLPGENGPVHDDGAPVPDDGAPMPDDDAPPPLDPGLAAPHHLLVLPADVTAEEVEALAVSRSEAAGWVGPGELQLVPGATLTGPWRLDDGARAGLGLPDWSAQAYLLTAPTERSGALPLELHGVDPLLDAFPEGVPTGTEAETLGHLRALARRLHGGVLLAGTGTVLVPDPASAVDLTLHSPVWLEHDACLGVLAQVLPQVRSVLDDVPAAVAEVQELEGYALVADLGGGDLLAVEVAGEDEPPVVLRGTEWAQGGVVTYEVRWRPRLPEQARAAAPAPAVRRARARAGELIERATAALHAAAGGAVTDDDGFLVDPGDLAADPPVDLTR